VPPASLLPLPLLLLLLHAMTRSLQPALVPSAVLLASHTAFPILQKPRPVERQLLLLLLLLLFFYTSVGVPEVGDKN